MIQRVVSFPRSFIDRRYSETGYTWEIAVFSLCAVAGAIGYAWVGMNALEAIPRTQIGEIRLSIIGQAVKPGIILLAVWVWYTVSTHFLAKYFGGRGPIGRNLRGVAWALIPVGIWYLIRSLVTIYLFLDVEFPAEPPGFSGSEQMDHILGLGLDSPIYVVTVLLGIVFAVWSWRLLARVVELTKDVSTDKARQLAAIAVVPYALYLVWTALQWL